MKVTPYFIFSCSTSPDQIFIFHYSQNYSQLNLHRYFGSTSTVIHQTTHINLKSSSEVIRTFSSHMSISDPVTCDCQPGTGERWDSKGSWTTQKAPKCLRRDGAQDQYLGGRERGLWAPSNITRSGTCFVGVSFKVDNDVTVLSLLPKEDSAGLGE